jgi:hypothetical protein
MVFYHKEEQALISSPTMANDLPSRTGNAVDAILQITQEMIRFYRYCCGDSNLRGS